MNKTTISWHALEFEPTAKSADWYWTLGIVAVSGVLIAIILGNILFAFFIIVASFVVILYARKHPKRILFEISPHGLRADNVLHPFNALESFWIDERKEASPKLLMTSKKTFAFQIVIPLGNAPREDVRAYLQEYILEIEQYESFIERITEWIQF